MTLIGHAYYLDEPKWTLEALSARGCCGSPDQVEGLIRLLREEHLITATNDDPEAYLPARAIETISLREILDAARKQDGKPAQLAAVQEVVDQMDSAAADSLGKRTLRDLVLAQTESPA